MLGISENGSAADGAARRGEARSCRAEERAALPCLATDRQIRAGLGRANRRSTRLRMARRGAAWRCLSRQGTARFFCDVRGLSRTSQSSGWRRKAGRGMAEQCWPVPGLPRRSKPWRGTVLRLPQARRVAARQGQAGLGQAGPRRAGSSTITSKAVRRQAWSGSPWHGSSSSGGAPAGPPLDSPWLGDARLRSAVPCMARRGNALQGCDEADERPAARLPRRGQNPRLSMAERSDA